MIIGLIQRFKLIESKIAFLSAERLISWIGSPASVEDLLRHHLQGGSSACREGGKEQG